MNKLSVILLTIFFVSLFSFVIIHASLPPAVINPNPSSIPTTHPDTSPTLAPIPVELIGGVFANQALLVSAA